MNSANNTNTDTDIAHMIARLVFENDALRVQVTDLEDANSALRRELIEQTPTEEPTEPELKAPEAPEAPAIDTPTEPEAPVEPTVPTEPEAEAPTIITPPFTDWASMGATALNEYESPTKPMIPKSKAQAITHWKKAVAEVNHDPSTSNLLTHLIHYCTIANAALSTRTTRMSSIKATLDKLGVSVTPSSPFMAALTTLRAQNNAAVKCKTVSPDEIQAKLGCIDGSLLTTQKLQDFVKAELASPPTNTGALLRLAFFSHHGNRGQDLCGMKYGKSNYQPGEYGYYDPDTRTAHLWGGKTKRTRGYVHFEVHQCVSDAIDLHHNNMPAASAWVFPPQNGGQSTTDPLRTILHDTYFAEGNAFGFPAKINPNDLRHLYETHIRHVLKLPDADIEEIMKIIGHSNRTSVEHYSETYNVLKN